MTEHEKNFFGYMKMVAVWHYMTANCYGLAEEDFKILDDARNGCLGLLSDDAMVFAFDIAGAKYFTWKDGE